MTRHRNSLGFSIVEALLTLVIIGLLAFTGWFVWHSRQAADKTLTLNNSTIPSYKKKSNQTTSVSAGMGASQPTTSASAGTGSSQQTPSQTSPPTSSNDSTLTIDGATTMNPTYYGQPGSQTYKRIDFTIHNGSTSEHTYGSNYGADYMVKGITFTKEIKEPLSLPGSSLWQSSTIAPGGSAKGYILFNLNDEITTLQWSAPWNSDTLYYTVPSN